MLVTSEIVTPVTCSNRLNFCLCFYSTETAAVAAADGFLVSLRISTCSKNVGNRYF